MKTSLKKLKANFLLVASVSMSAFTFIADALDFVLNALGLAALLS